MSDRPLSICGKVVELPNDTDCDLKYMISIFYNGIFTAPKEVLNCELKKNMIYGVSEMRYFFSYIAQSFNLNYRTCCSYCSIQTHILCHMLISFWMFLSNTCCW